MVYVSVYCLKGLPSVNHWTMAEDGICVEILKVDIITFCQYRNYVDLAFPSADYIRYFILFETVYLSLLSLKSLKSFTWIQLQQVCSEMNDSVKWLSA